MTENLHVVILAAGKGKRMHSNLPKVLHPLGGAPLISHVFETVKALSPQSVTAVLAPNMPEVAEVIAPAKVVVQETPMGTGHAVLQTEEVLKDAKGDVLILYGDAPLIPATLLEKMVQARKGLQAAAVVLSMDLDEPEGYGRVLADEHHMVEKIVECRDATPEQKQVSLCNSGVMLVAAEHLFPLLHQVNNENAQGEYYLPDIINIAVESGHKCITLEADPSLLKGVNSRQDLAELEQYFQDSRRLMFLDKGVTLKDPFSTFFSFDTTIAEDVTIEPHVVINPGVKIEKGATIKAFSHLEGAHIKENATIGPFARLRPGTEIGEKARVGNFVEVKNATLAKGAKANHLSYIGDAEVGENANIGAGTITCNYNGFTKSKTTIEADVLIGSNSALVAPVTIKAGAIVGAGSTITKDVEGDELALSRIPQTNLPKGAKEFREKQGKKTGS